MRLSIWQVDPANLTPYYNLATCEALADAGQNVHYITSKYLHNQNLPISNKFTTEYAYFRVLEHQWLLKYPQLRKIFRGVSYPLDHQRVLKRIAQQRPDIVHIQWSRLPLFDKYFIRQIKRMNIPVVHTIHNVKSSFASENDIKLLGDVYAQCDLILLHAKSNQQEFLTLYPHISQEKTTILPLISPPYEPAQNVGDRGELRHQFNLSNDKFVFLAFGLIRQYKGLSLLLDAFQLAHEVTPNLRLVIAGKVESHQDFLDVERARHLEGVIVDERFIPSEDIWKYFCIADVAVFPYTAITQSAALIQAMQFAKPVIATDVGAFSESIDDNGWIVEPNNVSALADIMIFAANQSKDTLKLMGARSLELINTRHGSATIANQLLEIYHSLL